VPDLSPYRPSGFGPIPRLCFSWIAMLLTWRETKTPTAYTRISSNSSTPLIILFLPFRPLFLQTWLPTRIPKSLKANRVHQQRQ